TGDSLPWRGHDHSPPLVGPGARPEGGRCASSAPTDMATTPSTTPGTAPSDPTSPGDAVPAARRTSMVSAFLRGGAVGATEALPGISGGTVALIVRLYDDLISGAGHVVSGLKAAVTDGLA